MCIMACVFCHNLEFQRWADSLGDRRVEDDEDAKAFILDTCSVTTRNALDSDAAAAERFHEQIRKPFLAWKEAQHAQR
jgi:pyruvate-formate lyase-activating enzyme